MKREFQEAFLNLPSTSESSDTEKSKLVNVVFVCDEWNSSKCGLSTFNREFAINIAILDVTSLFLSMTSQGLGSQFEDSLFRCFSIILDLQLPLDSQLHVSLCPHNLSVSAFLPSLGHGFLHW